MWASVYYKENFRNQCKKEENKNKALNSVMNSERPVHNTSKNNNNKTNKTITLSERKKRTKLVYVSLERQGPG